MADQLIYEFATPLYLTHWPEAEKYEDLLVNAVHSEVRRAKDQSEVVREQETPSVTMTDHTRQPTMTMSIGQARMNKTETFGDFHIRHGSLRPFFLWCLGSYRSMLELLTPNFSPELLPKIANCWASVYYSGDYHRTHNHPMSAFSGVYCVRTPRVQPPDGTLDFHDPRPQVNYYQPVLPVFGCDMRHLMLQAGDFVVFPGWLKHSVNPFFTEGERITISINFDYQAILPA